MNKEEDWNEWLKKNCKQKNIKNILFDAELMTERLRECFWESSQFYRTFLEVEMDWILFPEDISSHSQDWSSSSLMENDTSLMITRSVCLLKRLERPDQYSPTTEGLIFILFLYLIHIFNSKLH